MLLFVITRFVFSSSKCTEIRLRPGIPLPARRLRRLELGSVLRPPSTQNPGYVSGLSGYDVRLVNEIILRGDGSVLRWVTRRLAYLTKPPRPTQPGHPSVDRRNESTGDGYTCHGLGRKGNFCITVNPVTRTAGSLTQSIKGAGC